MQAPDGSVHVPVPEPEDVIENLFTYHKPEGDEEGRYITIRNQAKNLARIIDHACPQSAARTIAMNKLREAVMWANASIATKGASYR